jgi:hypothetical protein
MPTESLPSSLESLGQALSSVQAARADTSPQNLRACRDALELLRAAMEADPALSQEVDRRSWYVVRQCAAGSQYDAARLQALECWGQLPRFPEISPGGIAAADLRKWEPSQVEDGGEAEAKQNSPRVVAHLEDVARDLKTLRREEGILGEAASRLQSWRLLSLQVAEESRRLGADGCRYLSDLAMVDAALQQTNLFTEGALEAIGPALESLIGWLGKRPASRGSVGTSRKIGGKRSTQRGEALPKIIAGLTKHHRYLEESGLNLEPVGVNELAGSVDVVKSTVSAFFKKQFGGHGKYQAMCRDAATVVAFLRLLNGEVTPRMLTGQIRAVEDAAVEDDEEDDEEEE